MQTGARDLIEGAERIQSLEYDKSVLMRALSEIVNNSAVQTDQLRDARDLLAKVSPAFLILYRLF